MQGSSAPSSGSGSHISAAGAALPLPEGGRTQSQQRLKARSPAHLGAGTGSTTPSVQRFCSNRKAATFRQGTSSRRCYFQKPTTRTLKHLLHAQLPRPAQEASVHTRAAGAHWLAAKQIGSLRVTLKQSA